MHTSRTALLVTVVQQYNSAMRATPQALSTHETVRMKQIRVLGVSSVKTCEVPVGIYPQPFQYFHEVDYI